LHAILTASFVALPFLLQNELSVPLASHWKIYIGALLTSLIGTIALIIADERQGKRVTVSLAIVLLLAGQVALAVFGSTLALVFTALVIFFAGFNFLEAALPARLSIRAVGEVRGASLGVFSSAQFFGAFVGGVAGGTLLGTGKPALVFAVCAVVALVWLAMQRTWRDET